MHNIKDMVNLRLECLKLALEFHKDNINGFDSIKNTADKLVDYVLGNAWLPEVEKYT